MTSYSRRSFLQLTLAGSVSLAAASAHGKDKIVLGEESDFTTDMLDTEQQQGDPDGPTEAFTYQKNAETGYFGFAWDYANSDSGIDLPEKDAALLRGRLLEIAGQYADDGVSRDTAPKTVARFLQLFGLDLRYPDGHYVPYCAAGVFYSFCRAYSEIAPKVAALSPITMGAMRKTFRPVYQYYALPSPSVRDIKADALKRGRWMPERKQEVEPGELVIFSWSRSGIPNHVGIVLNSQPKLLDTIEFNTSKLINGNQRNGGVVARRQRVRNSTVLGFVRIG